MRARRANQRTSGLFLRRFTRGTHQTAPEAPIRRLRSPVIRRYARPAHMLAPGRLARVSGRLRPAPAGAQLTAGARAAASLVIGYTPPSALPWTWGISARPTTRPPDPADTEGDHGPWEFP